MAAGMQLSLFRTDSESGNSDSNPIDSIALAEFAGAAVKEEDNLLERFMTLRLYKNDDMQWLDPTYPQSEDEIAEMEDTSPDNDRYTTYLSVKTKEEREVMIPDVTSSSIV